MGDRGLTIFLYVLFITGGITILILTWVQPMSIVERTITTIIGSILLVSGLLKILHLRVKQKNKEYFHKVGD